MEPESISGIETALALLRERPRFGQLEIEGKEHGMMTGISSRGLTRKLDAAYQHWDMRRRANLQPQPEAPRAAGGLSIAISREAGTHGTAVAEEVGRRLQ